VIAGVSLQKEGDWASITGRGLGKILGVLQPDAAGQPTSLGKLLMPHSLLQDSPLVADYIRVSAKKGTDTETHEFHHLKSANRTKKNISQCTWVEADYSAWQGAGGWKVVDKEEEEEEEVGGLDDEEL
jgi:hypothetical protein